MAVMTALDAGSWNPRCFPDIAWKGEKRLNETGPPTLESVIAAHGAYLARLAHRLLGWSDDVDDVMQEVFLAVHRGLPRYRGHASMRTWLAAITVNTCRSHQRRRRLWSLRSHREREDVPSPLSLDNTEMERAVRDAIRALPARYREVVLLTHLEGMPVPRVSEILGIGASAVHARLQRGRAMLREALAPLVAEERAPSSERMP